MVSWLQFLILSVENLYKDKLLIFNSKETKKTQSSIICLPSHKVFQNATLSGALTSYHGDLWQIYARWLPNMSECILDFVHNGDKVFHAFIPHFGIEKNFTSPCAHFPVHQTLKTVTRSISQDGGVSRSAEVDFSMTQKSFRE